MTTTKTTYPRKRLASRTRPAARPCKFYDPITNYLPESLVTDNILSRLPTKDVVRTSVLSKAWQHIWTSSCHVSISNGDIPCGQRGKIISFINAMNKILDHPTSNPLRSFRLSSSFFDDQTTIQTWIPAILGHKLERLEIKLSVEGNVYPSCLLNSTSLRKLSLHHYRSTLCVGGKNLAPNLTTLSISHMTINVNEENPGPSTSSVKFDFPVLENFTLVHVRWMNVKSVEICAPSLTTFKTGRMNFSGWDHEFLITIVSPKLTSFVCSGGVPEVLITNGSSVVSAVLVYEKDYVTNSLDVRKTIGLRVSNLVNRFTSLDELELSGFAAEALVSGPRFHAKLVTTLRLPDWCSAEQLLGLLHAMPSLKFLVVNVGQWKTYDYKAKESVPSCIVSQLEEVVLRFFSGELPQYRLARFLSENANQLKKLTLVTEVNASRTLSRVRHQLSTLTRFSHTLEIDARAFLGQTEFGSYPYFL